jgi:3-oxoacyl-[acyl-carrier-protein] synthase II
MAVRDAGIDASGDEGPWRDRSGMVCVGTTDGGGYELDAMVRAELDDAPPQVRAALARRVPATTLSVAVVRELGLSRAEAVTVATACAAGNYAIGAGLDALRSGDVEFAVCGGADAVSRRNFTGFYRLGLIAPDRCRPFDADRRGILTGEGAGVLVLETAESAARRGARVYAEVLGYGLACDAADPLAPAREGIARCMRTALADAGVTPAEVDYISAHGTGTRTNDVTESQAIHDVFGAAPPRTVGLKGMLGHTMGAATALAGIACALSIRDGFIPPTVNHERTDPDCALDCVPNQAVSADVRVVQNNGLDRADPGLVGDLAVRPGPPGVRGGTAHRQATGGGRPARCPRSRLRSARSPGEQGNPRTGPRDGVGARHGARVAGRERAGR